MRRAWELCHLAINSLRRTPLRVALTSSGIAIATGALVSMVGFALGLQARVEEPFQKLELLNRIDVTPRSAAKSDDSRAGKSQPPAPLDQDRLSQIAALPGVALAYPDFRLDSVDVICGDRRTKATAIGLPAKADQLAFVRESLISGRFFAASGEIILSKKLAKDLGFTPLANAIGKSVVLEARGLAPTDQGKFHPERRRLEATIAGVWDPPGNQHGFSQEALVLPLEVIGDLPGVHSESILESMFAGRPPSSTAFSRVVVRVRRASDLFAVEQRIRKMGLHTQTLLGQVKDMRTAFILIDLVLTAVGTVALVVAGLGILNTQLMSVLERIREIGIYKALGASDGDVRLLFLAEAALVGLLGGGGGLLLGRFVSWIMGIVVNSIARGYDIDEPVMVFDFPFRLMGGAVLFALLVSVVGGFYPANKAARTDPIRALRSE
jgi:putative ABC transport system permease protein